MPHTCKMVEVPRRALRGDRPVGVRLAGDGRRHSGTVAACSEQRLG